MTLKLDGKNVLNFYIFSFLKIFQEEFYGMKSGYCMNFTYFANMHKIGHQVLQQFYYFAKKP